MSLQGQYGTQRQRVPILQEIEYQSFANIVADLSALREQYGC
ncbi:hypothetical protein [Brochothrix thermosphacta]|nr:hypothetical protein [Brochothrix thermosphacta]